MQAGVNHQQHIGGERLANQDRTLGRAVIRVPVRGALVGGDLPLHGPFSHAGAAAPLTEPRRQTRNYRPEGDLFARLTKPGVRQTAIIENRNHAMHRATRNRTKPEARLSEANVKRDIPNADYEDEDFVDDDYELEYEDCSLESLSREVPGVWVEQRY
jgi:hypothetical protein